MDKELLIDCVKEYPFLYDTTDKLYCNTDRKNMAWREIARKVRAPARECKKTWTLLRDSFRRSIKKQKELENEIEIPKKWKYADEMDFLLPYFKYRRSKMLTEEDDDDNYFNDETMDGENSMSFVGMKNEKIFTETPAEFTQDEPTVQHILESRATSSCEQISIPDEKTAFATLLQYIIDDKKSADDIHHFFTGISATVRNFPPEDRIIAKAKVFELITTMELDILNRKDKGYDGSDHDVKSDQERD